MSVVVEFLFHVLCMHACIDVAQALGCTCVCICNQRSSFLTLPCQPLMFSLNASLKFISRNTRDLKILAGQIYATAGSSITLEWMLSWRRTNFTVVPLPFLTQASHLLLLRCGPDSWENGIGDKHSAEKSWNSAPYAHAASTFLSLKNASTAYWFCHRETVRSCWI